MIHLDTHVVAWLSAGEVRLLTPKAREAIESNELRISPMVLLELDFLREIGRLSKSGRVVVEDLGRRIGLEVCDLAFAKIADAATSLEWTRDPFDRVIVGHALAAARPLVSKDRAIRRRYREAIW